MYVCSNYVYIFYIPISEELYILFKKRQPQFFKLYQALFICEKLAADNDA